MPPLTSTDVIVFLCILVGIMLVVALYHVLFLLVDARRILRRVDRVTAKVEEVVLKPLAIADQALASIMELFHHGKKGKAPFDHKRVG